MAFSTKIKNAAKANKATAQANAEIVAQAKIAEGNGLMTSLPTGSYILMDIKLSTGEFKYLECTFLNEAEKEFKISQNACLKPIYDVSGENLNQFEPFSTDQIGETLSIELLEDFGFRAVWRDGSPLPATSEGFKYLNPSTGEMMKGKKTRIMKATWE